MRENFVGKRGEESVVYLYSSKWFDKMSFKFPVDVYTLGIDVLKGAKGKYALNAQANVDLTKAFLRNVVVDYTLVDDEIASLQKNIEGLKVEIEAQELFYKKALDKANFNQKVLEDKYISLQKQQATLLNEQEILKQNLEETRNQNALLAQEAETWKYKYEKLPEELEERFNNQLEEEKFKMRSEYNEKLNKIEEDVTAGKTNDWTEMKQIAKVIEILNDSVTFQLNNQNLSSFMKKGDKLNVVRDLGGNIIPIGTLKISNISSFSTFGRADINELNSGMSLRIGDTLIIAE